MLKRRKTIENGVIYDGNIPYAKQSDSGKIPVVNAKGEWETKEAPDSLPAVTSSDNGKILGVKSGKWQKVAAPSSLPSVTFADNGKLLGVTEGAWGKVDAPAGGGDLFIATFTQDPDLGQFVCDKTFAEIVAAIEAEKAVFGIFQLGGPLSIQTLAEEDESYTVTKVIFTFLYTVHISDTTLCELTISITSSEVTMESVTNYTLTPASQ